MNDIIQYIIGFLLGDNASPDDILHIGYTSDENDYSNYKLVIHPSGFFNSAVYGTDHSLPQLPLAEWESTPLLFGTPQIEKYNDTVVLYADIIASTYFLITRYEEMIRNDGRDKHERFLGKESLPYRAGFIHRPIVDEYGRLLRGLLRDIGVDIKEPEKKIQQIYLTHDVDVLARYTTLRGMIGGVLRGDLKNAVKTCFSGVENDPYYTFPYLYKTNKVLSNAETIAFIKSGGGNRKEDQPLLDIKSKDFKELFQLSDKYNVRIGLHASYEAGVHPELIKEEREKLESVLGYSVNYNRHHYLNARKPEDMDTLIDAGITDDFTMGYADVAGFRLGTCCAVRWINPVKKQLTTLTLHPLTVMDVSLSAEQYMNLNEDEAFHYSVKLIEETRKYGGELSLLWHNTSVVNGLNYHRDLYKRLIDYLGKERD